MKNYLLIASLGKSDLKFIIKQGEEIQLAEIFSKRNDNNYLSLRKVHQALLDKEIPFAFDAQLNSAKRIREKIFFKRSDPQQGQGAIEAVVETGKTIATDQQGNYLLYAAKLNGLIHFLKEKAAQGELQIKGALFIGTMRPNNQKEPIASHVLLAEFFAQQLSLNYAGELPENGLLVDCPVYHLNQLKDLDEKNRFYDGKGLDYPVKRIVAKRIDDSIQQFVNYFPQNTDIILSDTGGMADLKSLLSASVYFRCKGNVLEFPQTEMSDKFDKNTFEILTKQRHQISRQQSLQIKTLVKQRILQGDFAGAWAACAHIHDENQPVQHDIWTYAVKAVNSYLHGSIPDKLPKIDYAKDLQTDFDKLQDLLNELCDESDHLKQAQAALTRTLFSIEASLQATSREEMDIKQAAALTSSLDDQLLRASVFKYLENNRTQYTDLKAQSELEYFNDEVLTRPWQNCQQDKLFQFDRKKQCTTKLNIFYGRNQWRAKLKQANQQSITCLFHKRLFCQAKNLPHLQNWRNKIAHGLGLKHEDSEKILKIACDSSKKQPIWNPDLLCPANLPLETGHCILNQYYTQQIEVEFDYGKDSFQQKYQKLQTTLLSIIEASIYLAEQP